MSSNKVLSKIALRFQNEEYNGWNDKDEAAQDVRDLIIKHASNNNKYDLMNELMEMGLQHDDADFFCRKEFLENEDIPKVEEPPAYEGADGIDMSDPLPEEPVTGIETFDELNKEMSKARNVKDVQGVFDSLHPNHRINENQMNKTYLNAFRKHLPKVKYPEDKGDIPKIIKKHADEFVKFDQQKVSKGSQSKNHTLMAKQSLPSKEKRDVSNLSMNNFNKFPLRHFKKVEKRPTGTNYTIGTGKNWIQTQAHKYAKPGGPKNYGVMCNAAALWLANNDNTDTSPFVAQSMLDNAALWYGPFDDKTVKKPSQVTFQDYLPKKVNVLYGIYPLYTPEDLKKHESDFKRDKPIYKAAMKWLETKEGDYTQIRNGLANVFAKVYRKQAPEGGISQEQAVENVTNAILDEITPPVIDPVEEMDGVYAQLEYIMEWAKANDMMQYVKLTAYLAALWEARSVSQVISISVVYFADDLPEWVFTRLKVVREHIRQGGDEEGEAFSLWSFAKCLATRIGNVLWEMILGFGICIMSKGILNQTWESLTGFRLVDFAAAVRTHCSKMTVKSLGDGILAGLVFWSSRIKACLDAQSLSPLFEFGTSPAEWKLEAQALRQYSSEIVVSSVQTSEQLKRLNYLRAQGQIPEHYATQMTQQEFAKRVDELVILGRTLAENWKNTSIGRDITAEMEHLFAFQKQNSFGYGAMAYRIQPLGICISGPAGSGKTNLSGDLFHVIGRASGLPTEQSYRYSWQLGVNFQDGLSRKPWFYVGDDIDRGVAPPALGQDDHVTITMKVVNNQCLPVESADVTIKGTNFGIPLVWNPLTNFTKGRTQGYTLDEKSYYRRLPIWVVVKAKPEYSTAGKLDTAKIAAARLKDGEYYSIEVFEYDGSIADGQWPYFKKNEVDTRSKFFKYVVQRFKEHLEEQKFLLTRNDSDKFCESCYATLDGNGNGCSCVRQGNGILVVAGLASLYLAYRLSNVILNPVRTGVDKFSKLCGRVDETLSLANGALMEAHQFNAKVQTAMSYVPSPKIVAMIAATVVGMRLISSFFITRQGRMLNAMPDWVPTSWVRPPQDFTPGIPLAPATWTYDELVKVCRDNIAMIYSSKGVFLCYGMAVSTTCILTVKHIMVQNGKFIVQHNSIRNEVIYNEFTATDVGYDLVLVRVPGLVATGIYKHLWNVIDTSVATFDELQLVYTDNLGISESIKKVLSLGVTGVHIETDLSTTKTGDCGLPYIARINNGWRIVALHTFRNDWKGRALGQATFQLELDPKIDALSVTRQGISIPRRQLELIKPVSFGHFPLKSEVNSAKHFYGVEFMPIGTASPPIHGNTMKTSVHPTAFAEDFRKYEEEWCGQKGYWTTPAMKGEMREIDGEEKWVSPYSLSLTPLKRIAKLEEYYWLALADYIAPIRECNLEGYSSITLEQAIVGVQGSPIQSVDLSTSMGMPHNTKKKHFIIMKDGKCWVDPGGFLSVYEEMREVLNMGYILCPIAIGILKDEQVSIEKRLKLKTRVFNCMPFAFNVIVKMDMAGVTVFLRNNPMLMECMVGINMTSQECNRVIECLDRVEEDKSRNIDCDIASQDKSEDGVSLFFTAKAYQAISWAIGMDGDRSFTLIQCGRCTIYVYKNDFFIIGATNPSGFDQTVGVNSIDNSMGHRYFYYRMKYPDGLPPELRVLVFDFMVKFNTTKGIVSPALNTYCTFRKHVGLVTYGDDSAGRVSSLAKFYDPNKIQTLALERGMVYTDGGKKDSIEWKTLEELTFLKRQFVKLDGVEGYVAKLSKKTIAKMLVLAKKSTLSNFDQSCALVTDALREMVYHGGEEYEAFYQHVMEVAKLRGFVDNPYFRHAPFDTHLVDLKNGAFSAFVDMNEKLNLCEDE